MTSLSPFLHTAFPVPGSVIRQADKRSRLPLDYQVGQANGSRMLNSLTGTLFSCGPVVYLLFVTSHLCSLSVLGSFLCMLVPRNVRDGNGNPTQCQISSQTIAQLETRHFSSSVCFQQSASSLALVYFWTAFRHTLNIDILKYHFLEVYSLFSSCRQVSRTHVLQLCLLCLFLDSLLQSHPS